MLRICSGGTLSRSDVVSSQSVVVVPATASTDSGDDGVDLVSMDDDDCGSAGGVVWPVVLLAS